MKTKSKISGYIIRSGAWAVFLSVAFIALSWAFNSPNTWHKSSGETDAYDVAAKVASQPRALSFAERVAYQRAIEDVYWRHRIWPNENPNPKPSLDAVMSQAQLERKVTGYLHDSLVLEDYSQRPITAEQLQAEMDRMARNTKQPEILRELFEALGNDPAVVAECLARPTLAERLVADLSAKGQTRDVESPQTDALRATSVGTTLGQVVYILPKIADAGDPPCTDDTWTATTTDNAPEARFSHRAVWTGSEMIVWGGDRFPGYFNTGGRYNPSTDSWTATSTTNAPSARELPTAVWTGSEMIIWGGHNGSFLDTGGRYNPGTDSWTATSTINAPVGRDANTAVWTGSEMIIWGGGDGGTNKFDTGGRYNPSTNSWTATSASNAPTARFVHTAVWTGSEMIVWGGCGATNLNGDCVSLLNNGGRYNPSTNSWTATSTTNVPSARYVHTAVWTGTAMIVWGGTTDLNNGNVLDTGGRYNPSTNSWTATSMTNAPAARFFHTAVWTGSEMIIWGGYGGGGSLLNTGRRYNPSANTWRATSTINAPEGRWRHTAIWTGSEMIVWGGEAAFSGLTNTGGRYCAESGPTPTPTSTPTPTTWPTITPRPLPTFPPRPTYPPRPTRPPLPTPR